MKNYLIQHKTIIFLGIFFHLMAVIFSEGYHRPDEHLAVIHMMQYKLGTFPKELLSWEYPAQIRPWLQPFLQFCIAKLYSGMGLKNPFFLALIFRLFASITSLFATFAVVSLSRDFISTEKWKKWILPCAFLISYFPFFHARATAENFGINFFIFGVYFILQKKQTSLNQIFAGLLFGISFIFRFQMGFPILFFSVWTLFNKFSFKSFLNISLGILSFTLCSTAIDYWGYEQWTFTPWNYLYQNIVLQKASHFGVSPFYYYLTKTFAKGIPPLSLIFIASYIFFWIKRPKHWISWSMFSFFLIHSLVGHKELRFIFGMGMFLPILIPFLFESIELKYGSDFFNKKLNKFIINISLLANFIFLIISTFKPAFTPINFYRHVYKKNESIDKIYTLRIFRDQLLFYLKSPQEWIPLTNLSKVDENTKKHDISWYLTNNYNDIHIMRKKPNCREDYLSYPNWILKFKNIKWIKRSKIWALYRCHPSS